MDTQYNLKLLGGALFLSILIFAGVFVYSQWDYQRFLSSLEVVPELDTSTEIVSRREVLSKELSEYVSPMVTMEPRHLEGQILEPKNSEMEIETEMHRLKHSILSWMNLSLNWKISPFLSLN